MRVYCTISILLILVSLLGMPGYSQRETGIALNIRIGHSDSIVKANVRANGQEVKYDTVEKKYLVKKKQLKRKNNVLIVEKKGFATERINIDSIFKAYQQYSDVPVGIKLNHPWDTVYLANGSVAKGYADPQHLMIIEEDTAKLFKAIKGRNLYIVSMYNDCFPHNYGEPINYPVNTYIVDHCYGAYVQKRNSNELIHLRTVLGPDKAGPVLIDGNSKKLLTHKLEIIFSAGTSEQRRNEILKGYGLKINYRDNNNPGLYIAEADLGIGDHIIGIAMSIKELKEVSLVNNIFNTTICTN